MTCRRCGKALGTDRGICPFCGAMLSSDQMNEYKKYQKEHQYEAKMITEKYGLQKPIYESQDKGSTKALGILMILAIMMIQLVLLKLIPIKSKILME